MLRRFESYRTDQKEAWYCLEEKERVVSILRDYQENRCYLCGEPMAPRSEMFAHDSIMPSLDHVLPKCRGGTNRLGNVALAHKRCNNVKADRVPTACEMFYAEAMAQCFEDAHRSEALQGFKLHIRGKGFMYRRSPAGAEVVSRSQYRSRLKRLAMEKMKA